jgi:TolB-like protein
LQNLNPEPGSDYFSDGLTDEIINNLSAIQGLQLKSQTSSFAFKGKSPGVRAVGEQLGANLVLEGSVLRTADKLRVDVQLIRVADDRTLWSGHFQREPKDVFAIQDDISRSIVNELRLTLGHGQRRYSTDLEAYDRYLKARALSDQIPGWDSDKIQASLPLFEATVALDPNFAPAYAGMADAYAYLSATPRTFSPEIALTRMKDACGKALHLDPLLAEAYACTGVIHAREHSWQEAENAYRKVFELNPSLLRPHQDYAMFVLLPMGRMDEAERELRIAVELDPLSTKSLNWLGYFLFFAHRYDEVIRNSQHILLSNPGDYGAQQNYARALIQQGRVNEGISILERLGPGSESFLGYAYARVGRRTEAEQIISEHPNWPWLQAVVAAGLGNKGLALDGLEGMVRIQDPRFGSYAFLPELDLLRGDPKLTALRKAQNLPEIYK